MKFIQRYITNISALQFIQLLRFATLFLIGIVFVRVYSTTEIGYYESVIFIAGALSFFWLNGILQSFLSIVKSQVNAQEKRGQKHSVYFNAFILMTLFSLLTVVFLIVFKGSFRQYLNGGKEIPYFNWLLAYLFFSSPANFIEYIYLGKNKPNRIIRYGILSYGVHFLVLTVPALVGFPMIYPVCGLVFISVLRFVWLLVLLKESSVFVLNLPFIRMHLKLAWPLVGSALLSGSSQYIDGFIVTKYFDEATFAIFRYGAREFPIAVILASALSNAMISDFSAMPLKNAVEKLKRNSTRLMHLLFPVTILFLVSSNWLFPHLFSADFQLSAKIFNIYLLLIISRMLFPQTILIGMRHTSLFLWVSFCEIVINVSLSILFLSFWGVLGVAYATVIAYMFEKLLLIGLVKKKTGISFKDYLSTRYYYLYSALTLLVYYIVDFYIYN